AADARERAAGGTIVRRLAIDPDGPQAQAGRGHAFVRRGASDDNADAGRASGGAGDDGTTAEREHAREPEADPRGRGGEEEASSLRSRRGVEAAAQVRSD